MKIFWICESSTGYVLKRLVYTGRRPGEPIHRNLAKDAVLEFCEPFRHCRFYCAKNMQRKESVPTNSYRKILSCAPVPVDTKSIAIKTFGHTWPRMCKFEALVGAFLARNKLVRNAAFVQKVCAPRIAEIWESSFVTIASHTNDVPLLHKLNYMQRWPNRCFQAYMCSWMCALNLMPHKSNSLMK